MDCEANEEEMQKRKERVWKMWANKSLPWSLFVLIACNSFCEISTSKTEVARRHVRRVARTETEVCGTSDRRSVEYMILDGKMVWRVGMGYHYYCAMSFLECCCAPYFLCLFFVWRLLCSLVLFHITRKRRGDMINVRWDGAGQAS